MRGEIAFAAVMFLLGIVVGAMLSQIMKNE